VNAKIDNRDFILELSDTAPREDYDRYPSWRPYPGKDVFLLCFSVINPISLEKLKAFVQDIAQHGQSPDQESPPVLILVGTKIDLRDDPSFIQDLAGKGEVPLTYDDGLKFSKLIGADRYLEVSSLRGTGVTEIFADAARLHTSKHMPLKPPLPEMKFPINPISKILPQCQTNLASAFNQKKYSDLQIETHDGTMCFFVHRILVAAASEIFHQVLVEGKQRECFVWPEGDFDITNPKKLVLAETVSNKAARAWLKSMYPGKSSSEKMHVIREKYHECIFFNDVWITRMKQFNTKGLFTDISVTTSDGKQMRGSQVLLTSNCGMFSALLDSFEMTATTEVPINMTAADFELVKEFLCSGSLNKEGLDLYHTYELGNKNIIEGLELFAENQIRQKVESQDQNFNPVKVLLFANRFNAKNLVGYCIWYLCTNFEKYCGKKTDDWEALPQAQKDEIEANQWPGQEYYNELVEWKQSREAEKKKKKDNCVLQ